jgi:hypothetical protein
MTRRRQTRSGLTGSRLARSGLTRSGLTRSGLDRSGLARSEAPLVDTPPVNVPPVVPRPVVPRPVARRLVRLAARLLPAGATRLRYEQEFTAELHGLSRGRQLRHALGVLCAAPLLRLAVSHALPTMEPVRRSRPLLCRLHLLHRWQLQHTEDGARYLRCRRCGQDRTGGSDYASSWMAADVRRF